MVQAGLRRYGFEVLADDLARRSIALGMRSGLREFYDPRTGVGYGAISHSLDALMLDMQHTLKRD